MKRFDEIMAAASNFNRAYAEEENKYESFITSFCTRLPQYFATTPETFRLVKAGLHELQEEPVTVREAMRIDGETYWCHFAIAAKIAGHEIVLPIDIKDSGEFIAAKLGNDFDCSRYPLIVKEMDMLCDTLHNALLTHFQGMQEQLSTIDMTKFYRDSV